jgi:hypothetical protein
MNALDTALGPVHMHATMATMGRSMGVGGAELRRRQPAKFAEEIKRRASENAADLKAGFERIRAAGRALQEARRQFDLGRVP